MNVMIASKQQSRSSATPQALSQPTSASSPLNQQDQRSSSVAGAQPAAANSSHQSGATGSLSRQQQHQQPYSKVAAAAARDLVAPVSGSGSGGGSSASAQASSSQSRDAEKNFPSLARAARNAVATTCTPEDNHEQGQVTAVCKPLKSVNHELDSKIENRSEKQKQLEQQQQQQHKQVAKPGPVSVASANEQIEAIERRQQNRNPATRHNAAAAANLNAYQTNGILVAPSIKIQQKQQKFLAAAARSSSSSSGCPNYNKQTTRPREALCQACSSISCHQIDRVASESSSDHKHNQNQQWQSGQNQVRFCHQGSCCFDTNLHCQAPQCNGQTQIQIHPLTTTASRITATTSASNNTSCSNNIVGSATCSAKSTNAAINCTPSCIAAAAAAAATNGTASISTSASSSKVMNSVSTLNQPYQQQNHHQHQIGRQSQQQQQQRADPSHCLASSAVTSTASAATAADSKLVFKTEADPGSDFTRAGTNINSCRSSSVQGSSGNYSIQEQLTHRQQFNSHFNINNNPIIINNNNNGNSQQHQNHHPLHSHQNYSHQQQPQPPPQHFHQDNKGKNSFSYQQHLTQGNQQHSNNNHLKEQQPSQQQHTMAHYKFHNDCQSSVLTYEQVKRLDFVMDQTVPIHGRGNFPTLYVKLKELIRLVKYKLQKEHSIEIRDVRLNGSGASYVLAPENSHYNDLDLIFGTDLSDENRFDVIRDVVLECLKEFSPREQQHEGYFNQQEAEEKETISNEEQTSSKNKEKFDTTFVHRDPKDQYNSDIEVDQNKCTVSRDSSEQISKLNKNGCSSDNKLDDDKCDEYNITECNKTEKNKQNDKIKKSFGATGNEEFKTELSSASNQHGGQINCCNSLTNNDAIHQFKMPVSHGYNQQQHSSYQMPLDNCAIKEAYVHKMVKVNDDDRWSLISIGVQPSEANSLARNPTNYGLTGMTIGCVAQQQQQQQQSQPPKAHRQNQHLFATTSTTKNKIDSQKTIETTTTTTTTTTPTTTTTTSANTVNDCSHNPQISHRKNNNESVACQSNNFQTDYVNQNQSIFQQHPHNHHHMIQAPQNHYQQSKQFPNSIELKFVDRMRRKFEFSVDSFQIILDSLIQFYDYAPQSSSTLILKKNVAVPPSSAIIRHPMRPLISAKPARCLGCLSNSDSRGSDGTSADFKSSLAVEDELDSNSNISNSGGIGDSNSNRVRRNESYECQVKHRSPAVGYQVRSKNQVTFLNGSRIYYQLPLDPANSPSISSVASSSGCSSSSSVVSSSSSSLSCDDDQEDLYYDADGHSSSSASTSSLISSTNSSLVSSDSMCNASCDFVVLSRKSADQQFEERSKVSNTKRASITNGKRELKTNIRTIPNFEGGVVVSSCPPQAQQKQLLQRMNNTSRMSSTVCPSCPFTNMDFGCELCNEVQTKPDIKSSMCVFETKNRAPSCAVISENFYPTVIGRSEYGNFKEALYHLEKKLIATRSPEEIRGGGLLKYCNLLVRGYKPVNNYQIRTLERYMCSRFFIDFSDLNQQEAKLESYLANHFSDDLKLKYNYLTVLHNVVHRSTVCLMNHELRLTLSMIRDLAYKLGLVPQTQCQQQMQQ